MTGPSAADRLSPLFSRRSEFVSDPNPLSSLAAALRQQGAPPLDLTVSNPTSCALGREDAESAALALLARPSGRTYRPDPLGLPAAREALSHYLSTRGTPVAADDLVLAASTSEAYSLLFRLLADPGETILAPVPSYPLIDHLAQADSLRLETFRLRAGDDGWSYHLPAFDTAFHPGIRALLLIQPANPTGSILTTAARDALAIQAAHWGCAVISDEVFAGFDLPSAVAAPFASFAGHGGCLSFTLGGLSKTLGLPQFKLGWIAVGGPAEVRREAVRRLEVLNDSLLSASTMVQQALPDLLALEPALAGPIRARVQASWNLLANCLDGNHSAAGLHLVPASAGWSAVLRLPAGFDEEGFALDLLDARGVLVQPGFFFDLPEHDDCGHVVISLLASPADLEAGLAALEAQCQPDSAG